MNNITPLPREATFELWWELWPRSHRRDYIKALTLWTEIVSPQGLVTRSRLADADSYMQLKLVATPVEIIDGTKRYLEQHKKKGHGEFGWQNDGQYIMSPVNFLNRGAWHDG